MPFGMEVFGLGIARYVAEIGPANVRALRRSTMRHWLLACSMSAGLIAPVAARAEQNLENPGLKSGFSLENPKYLAEEVKSRRPLMSVIDRTGGASMLDEWGIDISGHAEVSYTWSFNNPPGDALAGRVFDVQHDEFYINQLDIAIQRALTPDDNAVTGFKNRANVGGMVEWVYGYDARFIHANGLFDHYTDNTSRNEEFDLTQAYVTVGLPVGNGLLLTAGKFVTPIGFETINPTTNPLYSHSYLFGYAIPFTHTGVTGKYWFNDNLNATVGVSRGWEQSTEDNNDALDFLFQVGYTVSDKTNLYVSGTTGPEQAGNNGRYRTLIDLILSHKVSDELTVALNADWAYDNSADANGNDAQWYGVAAYAMYKFCPNVSVNMRGEWFNDKDGSRGLGTNVYEATLGLAIKPFPENALGSNLVFRPEVRYDYAQESTFDGGTDHDQVTVGADVIFTF